jgi:hypothetical protein
MGHFGGTENLAVCNQFRRRDYRLGYRDTNNRKEWELQLAFLSSPRKAPDFGHRVRGVDCNLPIYIWLEESRRHWPGLRASEPRD